MLKLPFAAQYCAPILRPIAADPRREALLRLFDMLVAAVLLIALSPALLLVAALIWASDGGAPLFVQQRIGRGGRVFHCLKFRTMHVGAERSLAGLLGGDAQAHALWRQHHKLGHDPRVTPLGRWLRRSSIDELPQLVNVLAGRMSLVGSRPIVAGEIGRYGRHFAAYCARRPGLSGLWQVSGRSDADYPRRLACDRLFARRRSFALYCRILMATIPTVLLARGAC